MTSSRSVRSQAWLPSRGPIRRVTSSPSWMSSLSTGPTVPLRRRSEADPQVVQPGREQFGIDAVPAGQLGDVDFLALAARLGGSGQALRRRGKEPLAPGCHLQREVADVAQGQVGTAWDDE